MIILKKYSKIIDKQIIEKLFTYQIYEKILRLKMIRDSLNFKWGFKAFHKVTAL